MFDPVFDYLGRIDLRKGWIWHIKKQKGLILFKIEFFHFFYVALSKTPAFSRLQNSIELDLWKSNDRTEHRNYGNRNITLI